MKTIIAGSREFEDYETVVRAIERARAEGFVITEVVSGKARGVDTLGERWANENGIPIKPFPVTKRDWNLYGKPAGMRRNRHMAEYAEALIAIWDGESSGTKGMIQEARRLNLKVFVYRTDEQPTLWSE